MTELNKPSLLRETNSLGQLSPSYRTQARFYSPGGREIVLLIVSHFTVLRFGPDLLCVCLRAEEGLHCLCPRRGGAE